MWVAFAASILQKKKKRTDLIRPAMLANFIILYSWRSKFKDTDMNIKWMETIAGKVDSAVRCLLWHGSYNHYIFMYVFLWLLYRSETPNLGRGWHCTHSRDKQSWTHIRGSIRRAFSLVLWWLLFRRLMEGDEATIRSHENLRRLVEWWIHDVQL